MKNLKTSSFIGLVWLFVSVSACIAGVTYNFEVAPGDAADSAFTAIAQEQLFIDVSAYDDSHVLFTFRNIGPDTGVITDIYFKDNTLQGLAGATLPDDGTKSIAGMNIGIRSALLPVQSTILKIAAAPLPVPMDDEPIAPTGVNPGESLTIMYGLKTGETFDNLIKDIYSKEFRIGIRLQNLDDNVVHSLMNGPAPVVIPVPGAIFLTGLGIIAVGWIRKKNLL